MCGVRNIRFSLRIHGSALSLCCTTRLLTEHFTGAHAVTVLSVCPSFHLIQRILNCPLPFSQARERSERVLTGRAATGFVSAFAWAAGRVFLLRGPHLTVRFFQACSSRSPSSSSPHRNPARASGRVHWGDRREWQGRPTRHFFCRRQAKGFLSLDVELSFRVPTWNDHAGAESLT